MEMSNLRFFLPEINIDIDLSMRSSSAQNDSRIEDIRVYRNMLIVLF